jgi:hypothetical protein
MPPLLYIYMQSVAAPANDWEQAVTDWYEELEDSKKVEDSNSNIEPFQFTTAGGHYTQVVWAESDKVGCRDLHIRTAIGSPHSMVTLSKNRCINRAEHVLLVARASSARLNMKALAVSI